MHRIANARMYAVTPAVEAAWQALLSHICAEAEVPLAYWPYPAPQPMEGLWQRPDLGCVLMCGYPIALRLAHVTPLAAPIPALDWAGGRALYRSDLIVRAESPFRRIEDTFGHRAGWTVEHSHSGFNAFRHHLLAFRGKDRPKLYGSVTGHLVTARRILDSVTEGSIDVGPLDGFWYALIARHAPHLVKNIRVIGTTALAPIPAFVAGAGLGTEAVLRLKASFAAAQGRSWFAPLAETLLIEGFAGVEQQDFAVTLERDREALAAGYPVPA
jgi:ABC-type phosphate/phosphonate transport system substrate-binding protein